MRAALRHFATACFVAALAGGSAAAGERGAEPACASADPDAACRTARHVRLTLRRHDGAEPDRDRLQWLWTKGPAFGDAEIGDVLGGDGYAFCVWSGVGGEQLLVHETAIAPGPQWRTRRNDASWKGTTGLRKLTIDGGIEGHTEIRAKGKAVALPEGSLPVATPVVVQVRNLGSGECWSGRLEAADVLIGDERVFQAERFDR